MCFYEHIATPPSLLLRIVLPVPQRTTGSYRKVGDVSRCMYSDGGYLTKKINRIAEGERIDFDIIEQSIRYAGRIMLRGGTPADAECSERQLQHADEAPLIHVSANVDLLLHLLKHRRTCLNLVRHQADVNGPSAEPTEETNSRRSNELRLE